MDAYCNTKVTEPPIILALGRGGEMREIRFRMYDTKRKEWVHNTNNAVNLFGETIVFGEILRRDESDTFVKLEELNDIIAMQYTGLHDKNGECDLYPWIILPITR